MLNAAKSFDEKQKAAKKPAAPKETKTDSVKETAEIEEQAVVRLLSLPPSISGQGGHNNLLRAVNDMFWG